MSTSFAPIASAIVMPVARRSDAVGGQDFFIHHRVVLLAHFQIGAKASGSDDHAVVSGVGQGLAVMLRFDADHFARFVLDSVWLAGVSV